MKRPISLIILTALSLTAGCGKKKDAAGNAEGEAAPSNGLDDKKDAEEAERKAPTRPLSAYQAFLHDFKATPAFAELPGPAAARLQAVAEIWKGLADDERGAYTERAAAALEAYKAEAEDFAKWSEARAEALRKAKAAGKGGRR